MDAPAVLNSNVAIDQQAQQQLSILGPKSALYKIQLSGRMFNLVLWIGFTVAGIFLPLSLGLGLFILGLINYLILLSFRLGNYFFTKQALVDAGAWDPFNVTEDADLSVRL